MNHDKWYSEYRAFGISGCLKNKIGIPGCRNSGLIAGFRNIGLSEYWAVGQAVGFRNYGVSEYRVNPEKIMGRHFDDIVIVIIDSLQAGA